MECESVPAQNLSMADEGWLAVPTFLAQWRKYRELTQQELGEKIGLSNSAISQLENGKQGFTDKSLADFAKVLKCTPLALLAHNPARPDSFWPLFEAAEKLEGTERRRAYKLIRSALDLDDEA
jgi:transcriptional regulator with XRE-family HTH domain